MGLWIVVQVAGSARELSAVVMTFSTASFIIAAMLLGSTVGWTNIADELYSVPLFASIVSAATDWGWTSQGGDHILPRDRVWRDVPRGVGVESVGSAVGLWQTDGVGGGARVAVHGGCRRAAPRDARMEVDVHLTTIHWWIIAVMSLVVLAGTFTVVFLSWVRVALHGSSLLAIYFVFFLVGLAMFLNPFIPGLPVYLTGGILLTGPSFQDAFGGKEAYPRSYALALTVAVFFCFGIKLSAVVMQQKAIGEQLGKRVWVRSLVNVNSITMRAIRRILLTPGLSLPRCASSSEAPIGPCPSPPASSGATSGRCCWAHPRALPHRALRHGGAFMLKIGDASSSDDICPRIPPSRRPRRPSPRTWTWTCRGSTRESVSQVMSVLTAFAQSAGLLAGAYLIEKVSAKHRASLEAEPRTRRYFA